MNKIYTYLVDGIRYQTPHHWLAIARARGKEPIVKGNIKLTS